MIDAAIEVQIVDLLCDEDEEFRVSDALNVLLTVVAGVCCTADREPPQQIAAIFAQALLQKVKEETTAERLHS